MSKKYVTQHQFVEPKVPRDWSPAEQRYAQDVNELFRYLYSRFNRLRLEDMSDGFRATVQGIEDHYASLELRLQGFAAAIDGSRLEFTAAGLDIKNQDGDTVLEQDIASGNLTITGTIIANAGNIGGLSVLDGVLTNGDIVLNMNNGVVTAKIVRVTDMQETEQARAVGVDSSGYLRYLPDRTAHGSASVVDGTPAEIDLTDYGFTETPTVTVTFAEAATGTLYVDDADETGFRIYGSNTTAADVNWIAIGR